MSNIDRNSISDARKYIGKLFSNHGKDNKLAFFLSSQLMFANKINPGNWNLNFGLNGKFLRFNVGQEFCIEIREHEALVLCLKDNLPEECQQSHADFFFRGYTRESGTIYSRIFSEVPRCLEKVPNSIGLVFERNINNWLSVISESNSSFIEYAIENTHILPQMVGAHSFGAVEYLSEITGNSLCNPSFISKAISENEARNLKRLKNTSDKKLNELAIAYDSQPRKTEITTSIYIRNPYVVEQAKRIANGICQDCGNFSPFIAKATDEPFLEVHHIIPLSRGGKDAIENVIALCPNCHRKRHYG